jgi:putative membrane protein
VTSETVAASPVFVDQSFVTTVGQAGALEVSTGKLSEAKSSNPSVLQFGALMVEQHTELGEQLKELSASNGFTFPEDLGAANQATLDGLAAKSGSDFDQAYIAAMVQGHQGAVQAFEQTSETAQNPALKTWATDTLPEIRMHLEMAEKIAKTPQP